jgi:hypothetical protein
MKTPKTVGSRFQNLVISFFGALSSRLERRRNERGDKQPEQNRRDHQRERELHRGHLAHYPANRRAVFAAFAFKLRSAEMKTPGLRPGALGSELDPKQIGSRHVAVFFSRSIMNIAAA